MQFSTLTILSTLAAAVAANGHYSTTASAVWVTDVVTSFVTVCPAATTLSFNGVTYTATESETITITNCPCTISKPVYTTSSVICNTCTSTPTSAPSSASYGNSTAPAPASGSGSLGTTAPAGSSPPASTTSPLEVSNNGNRAVALSGAGLAGLMAVAAWVL